MADALVLRITKGDQVRVHYHPPSHVMSFVEGVVCRTEVSTLRGRMFVVDVTSEVVLDRAQLVKPGYQNYVLYERWEEFPGRIEVLTEAERVDEAKCTAEQGPQPLPEGGHDIKQEPTSEIGTVADESQAAGEGQDDRKRGSRIISLFRQRR